MGFEAGFMLLAQSIISIKHLCGTRQCHISFVWEALSQKGGMGSRYVHSRIQVEALLEGGNAKNVC
jgi:hypothetical protein